MSQEKLRNIIAPGESLTVEFKSDRGLVAFLEIPAASQPISTSDGRLSIRYLNLHGAPGCRPFYAYELASWHADRELFDVSAQPVAGTTWEDLDPLEFVRLRRMIEEFLRGDQALLELSDTELARALGLVYVNGSELTPTMAGLLLVGRENALRTYIPAHEVAFQVLRGTDILVNEFYRWPLLRIVERIYQAFEIRNEESEINIGAFRVPVPAVDIESFREAVNNALIHRDYRRLGAVHVQLHDFPPHDARMGHISIINPGGFVQGIRPDNLLTVNPRPRNPRLAECFKRIGLVERIGRGVSIIYEGQLKNGHLPPIYEFSDEVSVQIKLYAGPTDLKFVRLLINSARQRQQSFNVSELLILNYILRRHVLELPQASTLIQKSEDETVAIVDQLVQNGLLTQADSGTYHFSPKIHRQLRSPPDMRVRGFEPKQVEQMILEYVQRHGHIARRDVVELGQLTVGQASYRLKEMTKRGLLVRVGKGAATVYKRA